MDLPPTQSQGPPIEGQPLEDQATGEQPVGYRPDLTEWLAGVERRLEIMGERLARLESSIRPVVAEEVRGATAELRRAMTELGRRLVQDLPHELARHRDAIVAELRPPPPPPPPPPPAPPVAEPDEEPAPLPSMSADAPEPADTAPAGSRRAPRRRRRQG